MKRHSGALLLVNADDFGQHPAVNAAIILAHQRGVLTSASLMAGAAAADDAVALARTNPSLDLGVHLTLTGGRALAPADRVGGLVDGAGNLPPSYPGIIAGFARRSIDANAVECEWRAQIDWVLARGLHITHLDGHQHLHLLPPILAVALKLAREYGGLALRMPVERACAGARPADWVAWPRRVEWIMLSVLGLRARHLAVVAGIRFAPRFSGMWASGTLSAEILLALLDRPGRQPLEIVCHPATRDGDLGGCRPRHYRGALELAALTDPRVIDRAQARGLSRGTFADL